jgi:Uma2 family endonuclease
MAVERLELENRPPLTVDEFEALAERHGWDDGTRLELLDGEVVWMSPINDPHIGCVNRLTRLFSRRYPEQLALLSIQNPIRAGEYDEPQPDVALLKPRADHYGTAKATPADILLLVEVADRTLRTDLGRKARIYADGNVAEYWVVDLNNGTLYVHRTPSAGAYATRLVLGAEEPVSAEFAPDVEFTVAELLG